MSISNVIQGANECVERNFASDTPINENTRIDAVNCLNLWLTHEPSVTIFQVVSELTPLTISLFVKAVTRDSGEAFFSVQISGKNGETQEDHINAYERAMRGIL